MMGQRVYFIRSADGTGPIKIGCTSAIAPRLAQLRSDYRVDLEVIADAPGDFIVERNVLLKFASANIEFSDARGKKVCEWFEPTPQLLAFIGLVKRSGIIPLTTGDCRELQMRDLYLGGATLEEIGGQFDVTRERVRQILRHTGVPSLGYRPEVCRTAVTPQIEAEILRLARLGKTQGEIADELEINRQNVSVYLRQHGVSVPRAKRGFRPETIIKAKAVAADYLAGLTTREIADKHGTHQPTIYRFLRIAGVQPMRGAPRKPLNCPSITAAYHSGVPLKRLADTHGTTPATLKRLLERSGVSLRSQEENEAIRIAAVSAANARRAA